MEINIEALEQLAKKATPGPWIVDRSKIGRPHGCAVLEDGAFDWVCHMQLSNQPNAFNDADFIGAANPTVVLALLERLRSSEAERDKLQYQISNESTEADLRIQSMQSDHQIALRREEEKGYARGLADGRTTVEIQDPWEPIETAIEFDEIIVTGNCFGEPEKGRFYSRAKRYEDKFYSTNEHGEEEEIGYLTHWIYTPESHYVKTFSKPISNLQPETQSIGKLTFTVHTNTALLQKTINDLLAADELAATSETVEQYRATLAESIEKKFAESLQISEQIALMPRALTAENGAKSALMGEFHETIEFSCRECDEDDEECELCNGTGQLLQKVPVDWTTIKAIYAKAVEVCEVKSIP